MLKALRKGGGRGYAGTGGDEEAPEEELQIDDDPDLNSPPLGVAKDRIKAAFATIQLQRPPEPARTQAYAPPLAGPPPEVAYGFAWKVLINVFILLPWSLVLLLSLLVNKWQLLFRPLGGAFWWLVDWLDRRMPSLTEWLLWAASQTSLCLHILTVGINLGVIWIMWDNGHRASAFFIVAFYSLAHYCSAVTMFKELDMREAGDTYFSDVVTLFQRVWDVLFYDIQMAASVIHSNRMLEGMTQVMFKGYEEARVALATLLFAMPCCVIVGVEYGVFGKGKLHTHISNLDVLNSYHDQLYAALCFSVVNSVEKVLRFSFVDPWMHEKGDGFPLLYVRSHAARLPGTLVRDWLVRCKVALAASHGRLVLKELYSHYSQQVKDTSIGLADPHKAYLLRKALHNFNTRLKYRQQQLGIAEGFSSSKPIIQELIADGVAPGLQLSAMLPDILAGACGLTSLSLAGNNLDDAAVAGIMQALAGNPEVQLTLLDLSGNAVLPRGAAAVASVLATNHSISHLSLAGCPLRDEGAMALAEALKTNISCLQLDLSNCSIGPEGAIALAAALKVNPVLAALNLSGTALGSVGCEAICKALRVAASSGLRELQLSHSALDDKAAASLAALLAASRSLERLGLADTSITDAGAQLLCNALQNNTTLQAIDVSGNTGMDKSWQKLLNHVVKGKARS